jgi:tetratricopeptide (TPR) repeat protein
MGGRGQGGRRLTNPEAASYLQLLMNSIHPVQTSSERRKRSPRPSWSGLRRAAVTMLAGLAMLSVGVAPAFAQRPSESAGALAEGRRLLTAATDGFFDQSLDAAGLRDLLERSRLAFTRVEEPAVRNRWQAEVDYLAGFVEQGDGRPQAARERFESGRQLVEESLAYAPSSQAYRLLADIYAQLLILGGLVDKISYGPKVRELAEEALRLDSSNPKARLTMALFYKNAPAIAGGSRARSLRLLHALDEEESLERVDRFSVYAWLGIAYSEVNSTFEARRYLRKALEVYPGNSWLQELLERLPA